MNARAQTVTEFADSQAMSADPLARLQAVKLSKVAEILDGSIETVDRLCTSGKLPFIEIGTGGKRKAKRVLLRDLEAFIESQSRPAAPPKRPRRRRDDSIKSFIK